MHTVKSTCMYKNLQYEIHFSTFRIQIQKFTEPIGSRWSKKPQKIIVISYNSCIHRKINKSTHKNQAAKEDTATCICSKTLDSAVQNQGL